MTEQIGEILSVLERMRSESERTAQITGSPYQEGLSDGINRAIRLIEQVVKGA